MSDPKIGLALGGGAARGIAHISMLEVFDELGLKPAIMSGTSAGALFGAAYASGISAKDIRAHTLDVLSSRVEAARRIFSSDTTRPFDLINFNLFKLSPINGVELVKLVFPKGVAKRLEECAIPFKVVTTDFFGARELVLDTGDMAEAVAASIAIPGAIGAPRVDGLTLIDGACVNPVPFDLVTEGCDIVVAIDVTGTPVARRREEPLPTDLLSGAMQIQQKFITAFKVEKHQPDILIVPSVDKFRVHDFFKVSEILKAAQPAKDELKLKLETLVTAWSKQ